MSTETRTPTNAPYEPIHYPQMAAPWRDFLAQFLHFCEHMPVASKEIGSPVLILWDSQRYAVEEIFYGLSLGIHDFVILKARQLGISTVLWALTIFWLTRHTLQGMLIADSEDNKEIHRDLIGEMYRGLPPRWSRGPWRVNNRLELAWNHQKGWRASRLMWAFANKRQEGQLGRSRGCNFILGDELDSWTDETALASLTATRSDDHPWRLYFWIGTGQGYGQLYDLWDQAQNSVTSRPIFVGFWRLKKNRVTRQQRALWKVYGEPLSTQDEEEWRAEVKRRYGYGVTREQLAWWRYTKAEGKGINGDEAKMLAEFPWLPEQAFQASGSAFIGQRTLLQMRLALRQAPPSQYFHYQWGERFDSTDEVLVECEKDDATLTMWEEPEKGGVYVIAADPAFGSGGRADNYALEVFRCFPDALVQVAEYCTKLGPMYQFAWVIAHLCGSYGVEGEDRLILEIQGPGRAVHEELERMANYGFGVTKHAQKVQDVIGQIQHFIYRRVDTMGGQLAWHFRTTVELRIQAFEQLRDAVERRALVVRSPELIEAIACLRRQKTTGEIEPSGVFHAPDLAVASAMGVHCWLQNVVPEIEEQIAPLTPPPNQARHVGESMLRTFMAGMRQKDQETGVPTIVRKRAPGR